MYCYGMIRVVLSGCRSVGGCWCFVVVAVVTVVVVVAVVDVAGIKVVEG